MSPVSSVPLRLEHARSRSRHRAPGSPRPSPGGSRHRWGWAAPLLLVALSISISGPAGAAESDPPAATISFEESAVVAEGLTAGGEVVFFGVGRKPLGHISRVVRHRGMEVADAFGQARYEPETGEVLLKSVWVIADVASGGYAVAAPAGFRLREVDFPGQAFDVGAPGRVNLLRHRFAFIDMLVVRPAEGAWWLRAWDTAPVDRDGEDNDFTITAIEDMGPLGASPAPPLEFAGDDVIVAIHPRDLRYYATRLLGPPATGGDS